MKTIGDLIDSLLAGGTKPHFCYLDEVCGNTPAGHLQAFRALDLTNESVRVFCETVARQIDVRLAGVCTDAVYEIIRGEGRAFQEDVFSLVQNLGITKETVFVPISPVDLIVEAGLAEVVDGRVHLTKAGLAAAEEMEKGTGS